jgi:hypothetical protein
MEPAAMSYAQLLEAYQALRERVSALEGAAAVQHSAPAWGHEVPAHDPHQRLGAGAPLSRRERTGTPYAHARLVTDRLRAPGALA